jgi:biopolymer transport protein TolR
MIAGGSIEQRHVWKSRRYRPMAEINVTPFVDVMLVLLIVFMVTAPLLTVGVQVDLPKTKASAVPGADEPLAITVDAAGTVYLQDTEVPLDVLVPRLNAIVEATGQEAPRIFIRGDQTINYGRVMDVMGTITAAGYRRVALIAKSPGSEEEGPAAVAPADPGHNSDKKQSQ